MSNEATPQTPEAPAPTLLGTEQQPQQPAFTPSYEGVLQPDGTFAEGWTSKALGPQYNGPLATAKSIADVDKLLRDNMAAARQQGIRPINENSKPEEIAAFRKAFGVPETPEAYGSLKPEKFPDAMWDKEGEKALTAIAHKHNVPPAALKDILGLYGSQVEQQMQQLQAEQESSLAAEGAKLKQAWGEKYNDNLRVAQRFAATIGLQPTNPIFNSAEAVIAMVQGASLVGEDRLINGKTVGLPASDTERATSIMTNPQDPLYAKYQSGDPGTVTLVNNMLQQR